ncbi:MAG TPA: RNA polymerase sigma factor [Aggregicoccus sp.]|nr:RNA polymerase sigma factor [Aggregicoccus sp.]
MVTEEQALVAALRRGEAAAFDAAYARWRAPLYGFLARLSGRREVAEDLLQETWMRVALHAHRLTPDTELGAWLFTLARNLFRSHRRWNVVDTALREAVARALPQRRGPHTPFELAAAGQLERRLEHALVALPLRYREPLLLVAVQQLSPAQAAQVLGLKPEALRQRLSRARGMLEQRLQEAPLLPEPRHEAASQR